MPELHGAFWWMSRDLSWGRQKWGILKWWNDVHLERNQGIAFTKEHPACSLLCCFQPIPQLHVPQGFTSQVFCLLLRRKGRDKREWVKFSKLAQDSRWRQQAAPTYLASPGAKNKVFLKTEQKGRRSSDVWWRVLTSSTSPLLIQICRSFQQRSVLQTIIMHQFWANQYLRAWMKKWIGHGNRIQSSWIAIWWGHIAASVQMCCNILYVES